MHPLAIEDALLAHQLPKLDIHGDQLIVVPAQPISRMAKSGKTGLRPARSAVWRPKPRLRPLPALTEINCGETATARRNAADAQRPPPGCRERASGAPRWRWSGKADRVAFLPGDGPWPSGGLLETARAGSAGLALQQARAHSFSLGSSVRSPRVIAPAAFSGQFINQRSLAASEAILASGERT